MSEQVLLKLISANADKTMLLVSKDVLEKIKWCIEAAIDNTETSSDDMPEEKELLAEVVAHIDRMNRLGAE